MIDLQIKLHNWKLNFLYKINHMLCVQGPIAQSVVCPTADPGVASLIRAQPHPFMETSPSADSRRVVVCYK